jgi:hypothetical protein
VREDSCSEGILVELGVFAYIKERETAGDVEFALIGTICDP